MIHQGIVAAVHGRQYRVALSDGRELLCFTRGKKSEYACGDRVTVIESGDGQGVIETCLPRQTLFYRSNAFREKLIAANVSQVIIVVACEPSFSDELVTRSLVAAEAVGVMALIVLNKCDLLDRVVEAQRALQPFVDLGYPVLSLSARGDVSALRARLSDHDSVLVGQSGMGKSTLINALLPDANAATREISLALDSGKHTTTHATRYQIDPSSSLIDSPGLQDFGLGHLSREEIDSAFPELRPLLGQCRFRDCRHDREPGCVVQEALQAGRINARRFAAYRGLCAELETVRY